MRIKTLFESDEFVVQKIYIKVGICHTTIYRKITLIDSDGNPTLIVSETKEEPIELVRQKKLNKLLGD